jgi:hypothetical protein
MSLLKFSSVRRSTGAAAGAVVRTDAVLGGLGEAPRSGGDEDEREHRRGGPGVLAEHEILLREKGFTGGIVYAATVGPATLCARPSPL